MPQFEDEFLPQRKVLDTSNSLVGCVLHQSIIAFHPNAVQMSKLNSPLEATRGLDKKDISDLTIGCVHHSD